MRMRQASYLDYGISETECKELLKLCQNADSETELLLLKAAQESNDVIAVALFFSLRSDISLQRLEMLRGKLTIEIIDFYAYRRKALYLFKEKLMENEKTIIDKWRQDGYARRYVDEDRAAEELQINKDKMREIAKKANAIMRVGSLVRINMVALYQYIDKKYAE